MPHLVIGKIITNKKNTDNRLNSYDYKYTYITNLMGLENFTLKYGENLHPLSSRNAGPVEAASHLSDDNDSGNGGSDSSRQSPEEPAASTSFARLANFGGVLAMVGGTGGADNFPMERENNVSNLAIKTFLFFCIRIFLH